MSSNTPFSTPLGSGRPKTDPSAARRSFCSTVILPLRRSGLSVTDEARATGPGQVPGSRGVNGFTEQARKTEHLLPLLARNNEHRATTDLLTVLNRAASLPLVQGLSGSA
jgi:hypothetical protein